MFRNVPSRTLITAIIVSFLQQVLLLLFYAPQAQTGAVLEEVIVTATKRGDQDIQSIAGSIDALSGSDLDEKGIIDFEGFAGEVPGLQFQDLGPGDKEYIIRGINGNGPAVVGAYFDNYVISANDQQDGGGKNAPIKMIDMERVEVLNGPQGTLYGAQSMAGNIRFIPRNPTADKFDANIDTDFSGTKEGGFNYTISGAVNVPLIKDVLALRFAGWRTDADGWIDQP
ncbi:MAG: TonB-dependent receptor plug domain-containing protein, partial [Gammaproteobacteria bacterium]